MTNPCSITLEKVSKYYQRGSEMVHALQDASLEIGTGEYVAVVGHSGSGKTTLLNIMGCLDRPSVGRIAVNGHYVEAASEKELNRFRRSAVGFVFQQFFLIPTLNVLENVQLPTLFNGGSAKDRAQQLLEMVGLEKRLTHLPGQLSGGEMQRVAIARSLINSPTILLADEPTGNLDSHNAEIVMNLFEMLNSNGVTIVVVTHNIDLAKRCHRMVHIEDGRINN